MEKVQDFDLENKKWYLLNWNITDEDHFNAKVNANAILNK